MLEDIKNKIIEALPDAIVSVDGGGGHFTIEVTSAEFEGKRTLQRQRMVYKAIWDLMAGDNAPLHAVDSLVCKTP
jgi:acid stress-induced BolA-like protein IbaG/YrbA